MITNAHPGERGEEKEALNIIFNKMQMTALASILPLYASPFQPPSTQCKGLYPPHHHSKIFIRERKKSKKKDLEI